MKERQFIVSHKAWYRHVVEHPEINISGEDSEFAIRWHDIGLDTLAPRLEVFDDAWAFLAECSDLLAELAKHDSQNSTPDDVVSILLALGFEDVTKYDSPYEVREQKNIPVALLAPLVVQAKVRGILFNAGIPVVTDYHETPNGARFTIDRDELPTLDKLPLHYDLVWRTDTSVHVEVVSIGDNTPDIHPFVCDCGQPCNGKVYNGRLCCSECLIELDEYDD